MENLVEIKDVNFAYDVRPVLKGINMTVPRGKVVAIMGLSGCGKTTLLRLIGGALRPSTGEVRVAGRVDERARPGRALRDAPQDGHALPVRRALHRSLRVRQRRVPDARAHRPAGSHDPGPGADEAERGRAARRPAT